MHKVQNGNRNFFSKTLWSTFLFKLFERFCCSYCQSWSTRSAVSRRRVCYQRGLPRLVLPHCSMKITMNCHCVKPKTNTLRSQDLCKCEIVTPSVLYQETTAHRRSSPAHVNRTYIAPEIDCIQYTLQWSTFSIMYSGSTFILVHWITFSVCTGHWIIFDVLYRGSSSMYCTMDPIQWITFNVLYYRFCRVYHFQCNVQWITFMSCTLNHFQSTVQWITFYVLLSVSPAVYYAVYYSKRWNTEI